MPRLAKTTARGYGLTHQKQRARWQPIVDAGDAYCQATICLMDDRWIPPGTTWDLGHTTDRTAWTGPEHTRCNRSEGARRRNCGRILARRWIL
jgi:hypothetical protein